MNTKKMIAVFAVLAMALAAFAFVPGEDVSAADDENKIVYLNGEYVSTSNIYKDTQTVIVNENLTLKGGSDFTIKGKLIVNDGVTVTIEEGKIAIEGDAEINGDVIVMGGNGLMITPGGDNEVIINGTVKTSGAEAAAGTLINVTSSANKDVVVNGEIIVGTNTKATLDGVYFEAGSKLTAYGDISTDSGKIYLAGTAILDGAVGEPDFVIAETSAEIDIVSIVATEAGDSTVTVTDAGMFAYAFGGVQYYVGGAADIPEYAPDAPLSAPAVRYDAENETFYNDTTAPTFLTVDANQIAFTNVKNIKVTASVTECMEYDSEVTSQDIKYVKTAMNVEALDASAAVEATAATGAEIAQTAGKTVYFKTMDVDNVAIEVTEAFIAGIVTLYEPDTADNATITVSNSLEVTGMLVAIAKDILPASQEYIIAAYFVLKDANNTKMYYYTTLDQAIDMGATDIKMFGLLTVSEDITVPAPVKLDASTGGVKVEKGATLTIKDGATFNGGDVGVLGALDIENIRDKVTMTSVKADVKVLTEPRAFYSNVYVAFDNAKSGDKLEAFVPVTTDGILIDKDLTLPEGVEFNNNEKVITVVNGTTFTVDGTLIVDKDSNLKTKAIRGEGEGNTWNDKTPAYDSASESVLDYSVIKIGDKGIIKIGETATTGIFETNAIAGAYFTKKAESYITNVPLAFEGILDADSNLVKVYGDVTIDANVTGTEKERVIIQILTGSEITFDGFTFAYGKVVVEATLDGDDPKQTVLTGDIGTTNGKIVFDEAEVTSTIVFDEQYIDDSMNLVVREYDDTKDTDVTLTEGAPIESSAIISSENATYISGKVYLKTVTFSGVATTTDDMFIVPASAGLYILGGVTITDAELIIEGDLVVTNTKTGTTKLTADTLSILGTVTVVNLDGRYGTLTADIIMVGGSSDSFAVFEDWGADGAAVLAGSGSVSVTGALFVFNGATVSADVLLEWMKGTDTKNTAFYVDGALWMTAYTQNDEKYVIAKTTAADGTTPASTEYFLVPALENMTFKTWQTYDEKAKKFVDIKGTVKGTVEDDTDNMYAYVGDANFKTVYASIDKEIYNIYVVADVGIDDVSIDGKLMVKNGTTHYAVVAAGVHTLSYTLANGYSGNAVITTIDGEPLLGAGLSFEVNDLKYDDAKGVMVITLSGVEKSGIDVDPETHPEKPAPGLTTTEILLIVVVIIMAIMAVVLILRLNRS